MEVFSVWRRHVTDGASVIISDQGIPSPSIGPRVLQKPPGKTQKSPSLICGQRFLVLTLMTTSILIFHTPLQAFVTWWFITQIDVPSLLTPFNLMLAVPAVMDPILFTVTLSDVQKAVLDFVRMRMR